ncbi:hypothetical protein [Rhodopseudomonas pseudopalustris]|uniref:hypothetical protein n=1 Tax=Rhodopseudomonas pseudopalustris TaxID=1513892 RepID=UPI0011133AFF|nr:hypothetical protein [Rhodopseudomonas pseudopalustris]
MFALIGFMLMDVFIPLANTTFLFSNIWSGLGPNSGVSEFLKIVDECGLASAINERLLVASGAGLGMLAFCWTSLRQYAVNRHLPTKQNAMWVTVGLVLALFAASAMAQLYRPLPNAGQATACVSDKRVSSF